jgi:hypothetical protein
MSANRQVIKQPKSLAFWRYAAGSCAVLFGAVLGFSFVMQHIAYTFSFGRDFRSFESVLALAAGLFAFRGSSARFVLVLFLVLSLMTPDSIWFALDMVTGKFQYAAGMNRISSLLFTFLPTVLPYAGIVAAVLADPLTYRAFRSLRNWPETESA